MAEGYDNTDSGALFKNKRKQHDRQPDMRGEVNAGGVEYWVSAWRKTSKAGENFISIALTAKEEQPAKQQGDDDPTNLGGESDDEPSGTNPEQLDFGDDIPF